MKNLHYFNYTFAQLCILVVKLILLNFLFLLCSFPVITGGAALTALFYAELKIHRYHSVKSAIHDFFYAFQENFVQASIAWLIFLFLISGLAAIIHFNDDGIIMTFLLEVLGLFLFLTVMYLFPVIAVFRYKLPTLVKHSIYFSFKKLSYLFYISCISILQVCLLYFKSKMPAALRLVLDLAGVSVPIFIISFFMMKCFQKYLPPVSPAKKGSAKEESVKKRIDG